MFANLGIFIYFHYKFKNQEEQLEGVTFKGATIYRSGSLKYMILEIILNLMVCPPSFDLAVHGRSDSLGYFDYSIDSILFGVSLSRTYLIFRLYEHYSNWTNKTAREICKQFDCNPSLKFLIRSEFSYRPLVMVGTALVIIVLVFGAGIRVFEM